MFHLSSSKTIAKSFVAAFTITACGAFSAFAQTPNAAPAKQQQQAPAQVSSAQQTPSQVAKNFYQALSEQRLRDALMMTNWRVAVEQFTPDEAEDLRRNFAHIAGQAKVDITGEQISGAAASVFVKGNDPQTGEMKVDELKLRRENNNWIIVFGDANTEAALKREGKAYFYRLWMENRHQDAQFMLQDIYKAELVHSLANDNTFADLNTLVRERLLSADALTTELGYRFRIQLTADKKKYTVYAEPVTYGKTGKLSFLLELGKGETPSIRSVDNGGAPYAIKN